MVLPSTSPLLGFGLRWGTVLAWGRQDWLLVLVGLSPHPLLSHLQHDLQSGGLRHQRSMQARKGSVPSYGLVWCVFIKTTLQSGLLYCQKNILILSLVAEEWCSVRGNRSLRLNSTAGLEEKFLCRMKNLTMSNTNSKLYSKYYQWSHHSTSDLPNGNIYQGSTSRAMLAHGLGSELSSDYTVYSGQWRGGFRSGQGTLYYQHSQQPEYIGQFKR